MLKFIIWFRPFAAYFLVAWTVFIIVFSSIPSLPTLRIHTQGSEIRLDYLIHVIEYGILCGLAFLTFSNDGYKPGAKRVLITMTCLVLFSAADEFHQKFIPGRTFNIIDLVSNVAGIILATAVCMYLFKRIRAERS